MGQSSNQFGIYIQTDKIIGIFSFSKYYRVSTVYSPQPEIPSATTPSNPAVTPDAVSDVETGQSWQAEFKKLSDEINVRHYSPKTHS